jgi:dienelactone hydrolase
VRIAVSLQVVRLVSLCFATALAACGFSGVAGAASLEQAKAQCHDQFVPTVRACVREKWAKTGGNPSQYIPGCREAIMPQARECVAKLLGNGDVADSGPAEIDVPPPSGKGRVVIVLSGIDGTPLYRDYAEKLAKLGYYAVVINGRYFFSEDHQGGKRMESAIAKAQASPNALPGKIAVIGFSMGGGAALDFAERQPDTVSAVIVYYPFTSFIAKVTDMKTFVGNFQVPVLAFAAGKDSYNNCCTLTTIKSMEVTAKELNKPMQLVTYPDAEHNFAKGSTYRAEDADDAWRRTTDALHQYLNGTSAD